MAPSSPSAEASLASAGALGLRLAGSWTSLCLAGIAARLDAVPARPGTELDASGIEAMDTAGAWLLQKLTRRLNAPLLRLRPEFAPLLAAVAKELDERSPASMAAAAPGAGWLAQLGLLSQQALLQGAALLAFVGETAAVLAQGLRHPQRLRWRPVLFNIRTAGWDALPIVGLLSFLLGVVVAYQGADQLRRYGANIFVVDLVGVSMLREFAPLITAIIIAGRSGSAYAAQIGTMSVTEEIDAMRTLGIVPLEQLVLPKLLALMLSLPLLTVFADAMGLLGGMLMARAQLGVGYAEFADRLAKAVGMSTYLVGLAKAPVFAVVIVMVGCYQGFRTRGGADSVGRQTTRSVVQAIFIVIVVDALFSIIFSALEL
ncbi:MlaE family ABC transporter permease [Paucibacter soli]|uniref:MlaE family ABC transporter permease n=1 Tax=Paucibacter soli TaxID=3133433 RepID=UPI0030957E28